MATFTGPETLNADRTTPGNRSYVVLRFRSDTGYQWSRVFVSNAMDARQRVPLATLRKDGWLFAYFNGDWLRVWGT